MNTPNNTQKTATAATATAKPKTQAPPKPSNSNGPQSPAPVTAKETAAALRLDIKAARKAAFMERQSIAKKTGEKVQTAVDAAAAKVLASEAVALAYANDLVQAGDVLGAIRIRREIAKKAAAHTERGKLLRTQASAETKSGTVLRKSGRTYTSFEQTAHDSRMLKYAKEGRNLTLVGIAKMSAAARKELDAIPAITA